MKSIVIAISCMSLLCSCASAREIPTDVRLAVGCASHKGFVQDFSPKNPIYEVSIAKGASDNENGPHVVLVIWGGGATNQAFMFRKVTKNKTKVFDLQNNANFSFSKGELIFDTAPLGGVWSQKNFEESIKLAKNSEKFYLEKSYISSLNLKNTCTSYAG